MSDQPSPLPLKIDAYYDAGRKNYLVRDRDGSWMAVEKADVKNRLIAAGARRSRLEDERLSEVDAQILRIQDERHVTYAGPLAGYMAGLHTINGSKVLITTSPKVWDASPGDWSTLNAFINGQLAKTETDIIDQCIVFHGWMKLAEEQFRKCLKDRVCTYGQFLILCGSRGCGKSLLQKLITEILGGRAAAPFAFMSGATPFNRELFGAEHQVIEDEQPHKDSKNRVRFGEAMKQVAAMTLRPCHGKNRDGQFLEPFWRGSLSVNDEPDHIGVLPALEPSISDKLQMLHCRKSPMPMPAATAEEKEAFWKKMVSEIPAYLHWLRNEFAIPEAYKDTEDNRYGLRAFHHPHITSMLEDMAPETQLLSLIDHCLFANGQPWEGTAELLIHELQEHITYGNMARRIVGTPMWCGKLLSKLASSTPSRVSQDRQSNLRNWHITPPEKTPKAPTVVNIIAIADNA